MIEVTPRAVAQLVRLMREQGRQDASVRVSVKESGCSGLEYVMDFVDGATPGDAVTEVDGLKVCVDNGSLAYLQGITLDWGEGLLGTGFKFTNPNAAKSCGCGKSFSV